MVLANYFLDGVSELFLDSAVLERPAETSVVIITKNGPAVAISMKLPMLAPLRGAVSYTINRLILLYVMGEEGQQRKWC